MSTFALVHPEHGTHFVYDQQELDRHLKLGWIKRPADWKEQHYAATRERRMESIKAEQKRLQDEAAQLERQAEAMGEKLAKAERVVGADTNGDGVIDKPFKSKGGRPKKVKE